MKGRTRKKKKKEELYVIFSQRNSAKGRWKEIE